ncbi:hypothetical protein R3P38DRAFT_3250585 [Favolaschia claudopus]|uniref:Uncharacterized protein n=1 Tax=Favolaschia claudopus TaxID=2862362 RepID=A0AAW0ECC3_9AGAR
MPPPPLPPLGFVLRTNRAKHPGKPDQNPERKSSEQVQQEKQEKAAKKQAASSKRKNGLKKAAQRQLEKEVVDLQGDSAANHPPTHPTKRVHKPRPQPAEAAPEADPFEGDSSDEYVPPAPPNTKGGSPEAEEEPLDPSEDEAHPPNAASGGRKKKDPKGSARAAFEREIAAQRDALEPTRATDSGSSKRKTAPTSIEPPQKKSKAAALGGLGDGWERGRSAAAAQQASRRSKSAASAMSVDVGLSSDGEVVIPPASEYNDSSDAPAGIDSDADDGSEGEWAAGVQGEEESGKKKAASAQLKSEKFRAIAGVVDTESPGYVPRRTNAKPLKKSDITFAHLPHDIRSSFNSKYKPGLLQWAAVRDPWVNVESWEDVAAIWSQAFPQYPLEKNPELGLVVVKLSQGKVMTWRHDFAVAAEGSLESLFKAWELDTTEERASAVDWLLQRHSSKTRVFHYRQYYDVEVGDDNDVGDGAEGVDGGGGEEGMGDSPQAAKGKKDPVPNPKGLCAGSLIIDALASHFKSAYPPGRTTLVSSAQLPTSEARPVTALVHSIQAANRALNYSRTGKLVTPSSRDGEFSRALWGDRHVVQDGVTFELKSTSNVVKLVNSLTDKQWTKILDAAIAISRPARKSSKPVAVIEIEDFDAESDTPPSDNDSD